METNYNIGDLLKNKLGGMEARPSAASFNHMLLKLEQAQKKKRRRLALLLFPLAAGLVFLSLFLIMGTKSEELVTTAGMKEKARIVSTEPFSQKHTATAEQPTEKAINGHAPSLTSQPVAATAPAEKSKAAAASEPRGKQAQPVKNNSSFIKVSQPAVSHYALPGNANGITPHPGKSFGAVPGDVSPIPVPQTNLPGAGSIAMPVADNKEEAHIYLLQSISPSSFAPELSVAQSNAAVGARRELLYMNPPRFKSRFYVGIAYTPLCYSFSFAKNPDAGSVYAVPYKDGFRESYLAERKKQNTFRYAGIPALKAGAIIRSRLELGISLGYYSIRNSETVYPPPYDTTVYVPTLSTTATPQNPIGPPAPGTSLASGERYVNRFSYLYSAIDVAAIVNLGAIKFKPGLSFAWQRLSSASYVLVDATGYKYMESGEKLLNRDLYSVSLKAGFSVPLLRRLELQLSPLMMYSPSSVFNTHYFITQKAYGFGMEGALLFKIPSRWL